MKKSIKVLLTTVVLTVAMVSPVFATEANLNAEIQALKTGNASLSNAVTTLVTFDDKCNPADKQYIHQMVDAAMSNYDKSISTERQNYITYLNQVVGNKKEIVRIKKANIAAIQDLVKVNPSFQAQLDAAVAEYNQAVADCEAAQAYIAVAQGEFDALQAGINANRAAKAASDADAIK